MPVPSQVLDLVPCDIVVEGIRRKDVLKCKGLKIKVFFEDFISQFPHTVFLSADKCAKFYSLSVEVQA